MLTLPIFAFDGDSGAAAAGAGIILVLFLFAIVIGAGVYFVPSIIAFARHKTGAVAILALNLFLG